MTLPGTSREDSVVTFRERGNPGVVHLEAKELVKRLQEQGVTHKYHEYYTAVKPMTDRPPARPGARAEALPQPAGNVAPAGPPVAIAPAPPPAAVAVTAPPQPAGNDAPVQEQVPDPAFGQQRVVTLPPAAEVPAPALEPALPPAAEPAPAQEQEPAAPEPAEVPGWELHVTSATNKIPQR